MALISIEQIRLKEFVRKFNFDTNVYHYEVFFDYLDKDSNNCYQIMGHTDTLVHHEDQDNYARMSELIIDMVNFYLDDFLKCLKDDRDIYMVKLDYDNYIEWKIRDRFKRRLEEYIIGINVYIRDVIDHSLVEYITVDKNNCYAVFKYNGHELFDIMVEETKDDWDKLHCVLRSKITGLHYIYQDVFLKPDQDMAARVIDKIMSNDIVLKHKFKKYTQI